MTDSVVRLCSNCKGFRPKPDSSKGDCRMGLPQLYGVLVPVAPKPSISAGGVLQSSGPPQLMIQERSGFPEVEGSWECENWKAKE